METAIADRTKANKARQHSLVDTLQNNGQLDRIGEFIAGDIVDHSGAPGMPDGIEGARMILGAIRRAFPDHDAKVVHMVAEGDLVATYKTFTGTHRGDFFGTPASSKRVTIRVMDFVRYREGKVAEHWNIVDFAGLMQQIGAA
jgi:steroid delta-isomerase-like uncharacterized protein